jgi:hypothetical protein
MALTTKRKDPAAVALGRKGGKVKGRKGFAAMDPEERARIQAMGAAARKAQRKKRV